MGTSGRTCTPTPSCPEAPPCTPVLLTACRRRSPPWLPQPSRSRSSLPQRGSTPSGSEAPSWPPSPPSSRCGSPSRSTTSPALELFTGSASKLKLLLTTTTPFFLFNNFNDWFIGKVHKIASASCAFSCPHCSICILLYSFNFSFNCTTLC